jgi:hypothetical protein
VFLCTVTVLDQSPRRLSGGHALLVEDFDHVSDHAPDCNNFGS